MKIFCALFLLSTPALACDQTGSYFSYTEERGHYTCTYEIYQCE